MKIEIDITTTPTKKYEAAVLVGSIKATLGVCHSLEDSLADALGYLRREYTGQRSNAFAEEYLRHE